MDNQQRMHFVDVLFEILSAGDAENLSELESKKLTNIKKSVQAVITMSNEDKKVLFETIKQLVNAGTNNFKEQMLNKKRTD